MDDPKEHQVQPPSTAQMLLVMGSAVLGGDGYIWQQALRQKCFKSARYESSAASVNMMKTLTASRATQQKIFNLWLRLAWERFKTDLGHSAHPCACSGHNSDKHYLL